MLAVTDICVIAVSLLTILLVKVLDRNPPPILGIYQRPNGLYWIKVCFIYSVLSLRKVSTYSSGCIRTIITFSQILAFETR